MFILSSLVLFCYLYAMFRHSDRYIVLGIVSLYFALLYYFLAAQLYFFAYIRVPKHMCGDHE